MPLLAASGAQADVAACTVGGAAGPITPLQGPETGVESVVTDLTQPPGADSLTGDPLTDTDDGIRRPSPLNLPGEGPGWEDGTYEFHTPDPPAVNPSVCLTVDTTDDMADTGLYEADIDSQGAYDNTVCGTGLAVDRGAGDITQVLLSPLPGFTGGESVVEANYEVTFVAGNGPIVISSATDENGDTLSGGGVIHITPTQSDGNVPCVDGSVSEFEVSGAFTVAS